MSYSARMASIAPFLAMEVMERGMEMTRAGLDVLQLGVGEPGFPPPPEVAAAVAAAVAAGDTHYTDSRGLYRLREAIAADCERRRGTVVSPDRIVVTPEGCEPRFRPVRSDEALRGAAARYGLPPRYVLAVGTLEPRKNLTTLLEAFARLRRRGERFRPLLESGTPGAAMAGRAVLLAALALRTRLVLLLALATVEPLRQHRPGRAQPGKLGLQRPDPAPRTLRLPVQTGVLPGQRPDRRLLAPRPAKDPAQLGVHAGQRRRQRLPDRAQFRRTGFRRLPARPCRLQRLAQQGVLLAQPPDRGLLAPRPPQNTSIRAAAPRPPTSSSPKPSSTRSSSVTATAPTRGLPALAKTR